jgi:hypothetical protein
MTNTAARLERVLWIACPVILFAVMFGHMTAVVYNALALILLGTLAAAWPFRRGERLRWPLLLPITGWAAWSLAAVGWSDYPSTSLHAWFDEVLYPLVSFCGFWVLGMKAERPARIVLVNWIACVLLVLTSALYWGHLQPPTADTFLLHFYNRVGHTSTLAVFAMPLFTGLMLRPRWRLVGAIGLVLCLFIGLATLNRFFWPAAAVTLLLALYPLYRRHVVLATVVIVVVAVAAMGSLELSSRIRLGEARALPAPGNFHIGGHQVYLPPALSGIGDTVSGDIRPKLWSFYRSAGARHRWTGIGFGKPLPGMAYRAEMPAALLALEPQALTHAHNLFLNTWLQTGTIGVLLQTVLLLCLVERFWRLRRIDPWLSAAGIALVAGMITKNTTDDFMWQTTILAFWSFAGLMLGCGERQRDRNGLPRDASRGAF